ncbi:hypothetical protein SAMD00023353_1301540 [Rosellinia necatrix]|uniref:Uncharacterized protein n=1 Tax=Rosellinia necatrix TaxID=77044 RepID=A0A1S8A749_ROSNE|nr:hypothetical protein SAMD00023353_1301540 [Rosellinia necatrix]
MNPEIQVREKWCSVVWGFYPDLPIRLGAGFSNGRVVGGIDSAKVSYCLWHLHENAMFSAPATASILLVFKRGSKRASAAIRYLAEAVAAADHALTAVGCNWNTVCNVTSATVGGR